MAAESQPQGFDFRRFYFTPSGRVNRKEFWLYYFLPFLAGYMAVYFVGSTVGLAGDIALVICSIAVLWPVWCVTTKRLHDRNKSAWWQLVGFIPLAGPIFLLVQHALPSTPGENRYGPVPQ